MMERGDVLAKFPLPAMDAASAASAMRWVMGAIALGCVLWLARKRVQALVGSVREEGPAGRVD
jgi:hypothetical protein